MGATRRFNYSSGGGSAVFQVRAQKLLYLPGFLASIELRAWGPEPKTNTEASKISFFAYYNLSNNQKLPKP